MSALGSSALEYNEQAARHVQGMRAFNYDDMRNSSIPTFMGLRIRNTLACLSARMRRRVTIVVLSVCVSV